MAILRGTNVAAQIVPFGDLDRYPSHEDVYGRGGLVSFTNFSSLTSQIVLAIQPTNTLTFERRKLGQIVYVQDLQRYYRLNSMFGPLSAAENFIGAFPLQYSLGHFSTNIVPSLTSSNTVVLSGVAYSTILGANITAGDSFTLYVNNLNATDHIQAKTKSFSVEHPTKPGKKLNYGSLESPYHGIRLTGFNSVVGGICEVKLPDYISKFVKKEDANIQITNYRHTKQLYVEKVDIAKNRFFVKVGGILNKFSQYEFYWSFTAIRKDVPSLLVEE
jgi:hypothetical protein